MSGRVVEAGAEGGREGQNGANGGRIANSPVGEVALSHKGGLGAAAIIISRFVRVCRRGLRAMRVQVKIEGVAQSYSSRSVRRPNNPSSQRYRQCALRTRYGLRKLLKSAIIHCQYLLGTVSD